MSPAKCLECGADTVKHCNESRTCNWWRCPICFAWGDAKKWQKREAS